MSRDLGVPRFLRTPPFPHTDPATIAISWPAPSDESVEPERAERLLDAIAEAKVGSDFWGARDPWKSPLPAHADGRSELVAIAAITRRPIAVTRRGQFGGPAGGPDRIAVARHLIEETRYRDPFTGEAIAPEDAVALLARWRRLIDANRNIAVAMGMAWWKRRQIETFLWSGQRLRFARSDRIGCALAARANGGIAAWPSRVSATLLSRAADADVPIVRVEDGFVRSTGLGSALHPPFSITVDDLGIHYAPDRPSQLEHLLETTIVPPGMLRRAAILRETIVAHGISKYGASETGDLPARRTGGRLVLVTGQVSDDLSVIHGGGGITDNAELLRRARAIEPDAEIWFRPHPDVDAGHRRGAIPDAEALHHADRIVRGGSMAALLGQIDALHVLTSLAGFEALLRGREVTAHGTPFYAGWGLTRDLGPPATRRTRRLSIDAVVAIALILYPRYLDPLTGLPCEIETLIARFADRSPPRMSVLHRLRSVQGMLRRQLVG